MKNTLSTSKKLSNLVSMISSQKGFTLVELLVVIAVLGVLAAGVLVAINPIEQLARGRDTGRKTAITELGRGLNTYLTTQGVLPAGTGWATALQTAGEIKVIPSNPSNGCTVTETADLGDEGGYCYVKNSDNEYAVYAEAESNSEILKAGGGSECGSGETAYIVFSSSEGKTGVKCDTAISADETGLN
jgi:prepilin-type N-terminal cleavage/methylation domain-containing protein